MKKRMMRIVALALTLILMISLLTGCAKSGVKEVIGKFEAACVAVDAEAMLDCMDPSVTKPIRSILDLFGPDNLNGIVSDIFKVVDFINFEGTDPEDVLATVKIEPDTYTFNDAKDECKVTAVVTYIVDGTEKSQVAIFDCIMVDEVWYIASADF